MLEALISAWRASGCALGGMFDIRYAPWFLGMSSAVNNNEIGSPRLFIARKSYKLGTRGPLYRTRATYGGTIPWVAIHAIDWVLALGGKCKRVAALKSDAFNQNHGDLETTVSMLFEMEDGKMATVTADFLRPGGSVRHDDDRLMIVGSEGTVEAVDHQVFITDKLSKRALVLPEPGSSFIDFSASIGSKRATELAENALYATRVALAARQASDDNCWITI